MLSLHKNATLPFFKTLRLGLLYGVMAVAWGGAWAAGGGAGSGAKPNESTKNYDYYLTGSPANQDITKPSSSMVVLMGGGEDVDDAFKDMIKHAGCDVAGSGGSPVDIVIVRTSGADGYNPYLQALGQRTDGPNCVDSVETLVIKTRAAAADIPNVVNRVANADVLFIAGGDQSTYINLWNGTPLDQAIKDLIANRKIPIGGTSAGMAVLGAVDYSGENGSITSAEAMANPYNAKLTLRAELFPSIPFMANTVTDTHLYERDRMGRLITFMARMGSIQDNPWETTWSSARGIGVTEATALVVTDGVGKVRYKDVTTTSRKGVTSTVKSKQSVYFLNWIDADNTKVTVERNRPLNFNNGYLKIQTLTACDGCAFNLTNWSGAGTYSPANLQVIQGSLTGWNY